MVSKISFKVADHNYTFSYRTLPSGNLYTKFTAVLFRLVEYSSLSITSVLVLFFLYLSTLNPDIEPLVWILVFVILMIWLRLVKFLLRPQSLIEVFAFDLGLMLMVSVITLISLLPFALSNIGFSSTAQNPLVVGGLLNIASLSSLSFIILLFAIYFVVTTFRNIQSKKQIAKYLILSTFLLPTLVVPKNPDASIGHILLFAGLICALVISRRLPNLWKHISKVLIYLLAILSIYQFEFINVFIQPNVSIAALSLLPLLYVLAGKNSSPYTKFSLFFVTFTLVLALVSSLFLSLIVVISSIAVLVFTTLLTIIYWSDVKSILKNIRSQIVLKKNELVFSRFSFVYVSILLLNLILIGAVIYLYNQNPALVRSLPQPLIKDVSLLLTSEINPIKWLFGIGILTAPSNTYSFLFSNFGVVGFGVFILVIASILYISLTNQKNKEQYPSILASVFGIITLGITGLFNIWEGLLFSTLWVLIAWLSMKFDNCKHEDSTQIDPLMFSSTKKLKGIALEVARLALIIFSFIGLTKLLSHLFDVI